MAAAPPPPKGKKLPPLEVPSDLKIEYVNLVRIAHSPSEMVFDFANLLPGGIPPRVSSRIVMSPLGAKLFFSALSENIAKYEKAFGEINVPRGNTLADHLFRFQSPPDNPTEK